MKVKVIVLLIIISIFLFIPTNASVNTKREIQLKDHQTINITEALDILMNSNEFDVTIEKTVNKKYITYRIGISILKNDILFYTDEYLSLDSAVASAILDLDKMNLI